MGNEMISTYYVIGSLLSKRRIELDMSLGTLAKLTHCGRTTLRRIETGERFSEAALIRSICDVLDLDFDELKNAEEEAVTMEAMKIREGHSTNAEEKGFLRTLIAWYEQPKNRNFVKRVLKCIIIATTVFVGSSAIVQAVTGENIFKFMGRVGNTIVYYWNNDNDIYDEPLTEIGISNDLEVDVSFPEEIQTSEIADKFTNPVYLPSVVPDGYSLLGVDYSGIGGHSRAVIKYLDTKDRALILTISELSDEARNAGIKVTTADPVTDVLHQVTIDGAAVSILVSVTDEEDVFSVATMVYNKVMYTFGYLIEIEEFLDMVESMELCE